MCVMGFLIKYLNSFFLFVGLWTPDFLIFDLKIGFLIKNCVYRQLEMSRIPNVDEKQPNTPGGNFHPPPVCCP